MLLGVPLCFDEVKLKRALLLPLLSLESFHIHCGAAKVTAGFDEGPGACSGTTDINLLVTRSKELPLTC